MTRSALGRTGCASALALAIGLATASIGFAQSSTTNTYMNPDGSTTSTTLNPDGSTTSTTKPSQSSREMPDHAEKTCSKSVRPVR